AFAQWGRQNPEAAWAVAAQLEGEGYEAALRGFARGLVMRDVSHGIEFLRDLEASGRELTVIGTVGMECGEQQPEKGIEIWESLDTDEQADQFGENYLQRLAQKS